MSQLMLVNPRRKKRRKMSALQRQYFGKRRASSPARRRRRRASVSGLSNPRRRRRRATVAHHASRRHRRRRVSIRARRNPRAMSHGALSFREITSGKVLKDFVLPAAIGGAGALALDVLWGVLPIPPQFKTGQFAPVFKALGVLGIGALASGPLPPRLVKPAVFASLTIMAYNFAKVTLQQSMPNVPLGAYIDGHMGAYISGGGMGYISPGQVYPSLQGAGDNTVAWSAMDHDVGDMVS